jgi:uncharacterized protein (DUF697 family)/GTP-binding protein EngB required for normal cell division
LICGQTGVGKSSVINYLFQDSVAKAGTGEPCTQDITLYRNELLNIYDSAGYEIGSEKQKLYERVLFDDFLGKKQNIRDDDDAVHLVWYAVSGAGLKFTDLDAALIKKIQSAGYYIAVLITKIDEMDEDQLREFNAVIHADLPRVEVFKLSIKAKDNKELEKICDWNKLADWSIENLKEAYRDRFYSSLKSDNLQILDEKYERAKSYIKFAMAGAAGVGASPIPFSDAILLVPIQTAMMIKILGLYGIKAQNGTITSFISGTVMTTLGKSLVGSLIKFIPGLGSLVGGAINAAIAGGLTFALGTAINTAIYKQCANSLNGAEPSFDLRTLLSSGEFLKMVTEIFTKNKN